ncbi:uncharacterized protein LOC100888667 isoform X1 [Strongylocentrotus purpuratus]|uniref:Uncharacterized protein n=2 Tax=Strongylocentrotus purpuratus TaxID=7668 RepID=A0A7M7GMM9_STRPU|nr:uncharacterized protein LOC100888667 isoform X1 [Strongylocentrotus purpuratus]
MFWEINILLSTIKELQSFRRNKDRDKNCILCKELKYSLEICCCIMSELEIHVSTPLRGINSVEVSVCSIGSSGDQSCRKLIVDVCNGPGAPSARVVQPGNMQMDQTNMKMKLSSKDESGVDEILEEELDAFTDNMPSDISSSRPETPIMTGTSPPIPIPRLSPIGNSGSFIGTPTRSSSFSYMYRFSSPEETSPLSSGYGSAPRFFQSTSTQTPPLSPVLLETSISLRLFDSPSEQDQSLSPQEQLRLRRQRYCEESRRTRFFSEGSAVPETVPPNEPAGDNAAEPLPDVVAIRRSRANSAPARPVAPEIATGRELRRIGDEFVALFEGQRSLRRNDPHRRSFIRRLFESWKSSPISESAPARTSVIRDGSSV